LSSPTLSLTLGQANSAEEEVLVQSFGPVEKPLHLVVDCCVADTLFAAQFWSPNLLLIRRLDSRAATL
jgi:hypothetical protein